MKLNWGYKILIVYSLFVLGILFLAFKSTQQKFDLVQKDYYGEELKYQNVIDATNKAAALGGALVATVKDSKLWVQLPASFNGITTKGSAHLYFPADEQRDIMKQFATVNGQFEMELLSKMKGNYILKLSVEKQGVQYYYEKKIIF
jgi:nitrogen fixation protein FixH